MHRFATALGIAAIALCTLGLATQPPAGPQDDPARPEFYVAHVKPIFDQNCARCHLNGNHRGGFNMDTRANLLKGGHDANVLVPGDPAHSLLVQLINHQGPADDPMPMPPNRPKLQDQDIATVTAWVKAGAVMP